MGSEHTTCSMNALCPLHELQAIASYPNRKAKNHYLDCVGKVLLKSANLFFLIVFFPNVLLLSSKFDTNRTK